MFEFVEEALDQVALFIEGGIEASPGRCGSAPRYDGDGAGCGDSLDRALPVIALVGKDEAGLDAGEQRLDLGDVVALAAGEEDPDRQAKRVGGDMDLGAQAALRPAERVSFSPLFDAPALCWCARTIVESTST